VTLDSQEQARLVVLGRVDRGELTAVAAAELLGMSDRQVRGLLTGYRHDGAAAVAHGNRGRASPQALDSAVRARVAALARTTYAHCNHQHLSELLAEREGITVSRSSLRRMLLAAGVSTPRKRRAPKHRSRRDRMAQEGMLLQIDGSRHAWLWATSGRCSRSSPRSTTPSVSSRTLGFGSRKMPTATSSCLKRL